MWCMSDLCVVGVDAPVDVVGAAGVGSPPAHHGRPRPAVVGQEQENMLP